LSSNLEKYPDSNVLIVGHTDSVGADTYNMTLSQRRAESAASYLRQQGVDAGRIRTEGRGEIEPVADNSTDAGRQENRRVEVAIFANEELKERAKEQAGSN